ncbi:hypothetical protein FDH01_gp053 [Acinetobacter phage vB_AbaM_ME3]|uniref:Uncharacterized protein n=1 Tax=Acinetobacter phage vB_AbaM_ME3 TaxID=1837876 RepID=A0A172Q042_9CAUD|nr:hypothetical protein FDH01_gp053 [Acinetobacter phage vB_AbaM_ME3]AND75214.1 hypothetical protein ME3_53 [Acinetobacter phage vB_AbaM_ME3]
MSEIDNKFFSTSYGSIVEKIEDVDLETNKGRRELELLIKNKFEENESLVEGTEKRIVTINDTIKENIDKLQYKINKVVEKVRGAIVAERGTTGTIYTTQIPINKQQTTNKTTTRIEDNVAFGVPLDSEEYSSTLNLLSLKNLTFTNLYISSLNKVSTDKLENFVISPKLQTNLPIEFTINLTGLIRTSSSLVLDMEEHGIIEIYKNGSLWKEKSLIKTIVIPVDINTVSISIRSYPSIHRTNSLKFNKIGYTELIYDSTTLFESKNININKSLYQLAIDTCDNSNDTAIQIDYYVSINDEPYEAFAPVSKTDALFKQAIITLDKTQVLTMYQSPAIKISEGNYRFDIPNNLQTNLINKHDVYLRNYKKLGTTELTIVTKKDIELNTLAITQNTAYKLYINDKEVTSETFNLYVGISKIVVIDSNKAIKPLNLSYLETLIGEENIYIRKLTKELFTDSITGTKYISLTVPEFQDSFLKEGLVFFPGVKPKKQINTLKIKAELKSLDKKTVPFISRILVRGI